MFDAGQIDIHVTGSSVMLAEFLGLGPVPKRRRSGWSILGGDSTPRSAFLAARMMQVPHNTTAAHMHTLNKDIVCPAVLCLCCGPLHAETYIIAR